MPSGSRAASYIPENSNEPRMPRRWPSAHNPSRVGVGAGRSGIGRGDLFEHKVEHRSRQDVIVITESPARSVERPTEVFKSGSVYRLPIRETDERTEYVLCVGQRRGMPLSKGPKFGHVQLILQHTEAQSYRSSARRPGDVGNNVQKGRADTGEGASPARPIAP